MRDMIAKGRDRKAPPERHGHAKLTRPQVEQIRTRLATEIPAVLAREFGVTHKTIRKIRDGITWKR